MAIQADVTDPDQVKEMVKTGSQAFGPIHILVNNAAYQCNLPFPEYEAYHLQKIFATNLHGYITCIQAVVPGMKEMGYGRIINVSSVHAKRPTNFDPGYSMTKGAIKMLTRECALELAPYHINVNSVEYGYVDIGVKSGNPRSVITRAMKEQEHKFRWSSLCLSGQVYGPREAAPIVAFLASEESAMVNGSSVRADTGTILT